MALSRESRIKSPDDFKKILRNGRSVRGAFLSLKYVIYPDGKPRMGVAISQGAVQNAAERNRIKRIVFAQIEQMIKSMPTGYSGIIVVRTCPKENELLVNDIRQVLHEFQGK